MNQEVKDHIKNSLIKGVRLDGRGPQDLREISIELDVVTTAEGSARVKFGDAEVLAGVKMSVESPFPDTPEDGVLMVNAELLPLSNPDFETGPPGIDSIETSRVIDRGIRESGCVDTKKLCLVKGEKVWFMAVDVHPINYDGNLIDMGGLAAMAALKSANFPSIDKDHNVDYHEKTKKKLDISGLPIPITVCKIGDVLIVDPTDEEENAIDARLTVTSLDKDKLCSLQKGGAKPLSIEEIAEMVELALKKADEVRKKLSEVLK